jgi:hypothetical protein
MATCPVTGQFITWMLKVMNKSVTQKYSLISFLILTKEIQLWVRSGLNFLKQMQSWSFFIECDSDSKLLFQLSSGI